MAQAFRNDLRMRLGNQHMRSRGRGADRVAEERYAETSDAELDAKSALLAVEPTTIEGAIALLRYASVVTEYGATVTRHGRRRAWSTSLTH
jgi:hypothetical protein